MSLGNRLDRMGRRAGPIALGLFLLLLPLVTQAESGSVKNLNTVADDYFWALQDRQLRPRVTPKANATWVKKLAGFEGRLKRIKTSNLDQQARITYRMLGDELKSQRSYVKDGWIKEDINGSESLMHSVVGGATASDNRTVADWRWTIKTLKNSSGFVKGYIGQLRGGVQEGRMRAAPVIESSIASLKVLTSANKQKNPFLALQTQLEKSMAGKKQLPALRKELHKVLHLNVLPSHKQLRTFLEKEYLPRAPKLGQDRGRYLHHMAQHLGSKHPTPEALGKWGRKEVARLQKELGKTIKEINPRAASTSSFMNGLNRRKSNRYSNGQELMDATYREIKKTRGLARGMAPIPRSRVRVTRVEPYQEATVAAQYSDLGGGMGEMQVNTGKLLKGQRKYDLATLVTHEIYGGHHLAAMYAGKQKGLPEYRRGAASTTYDEGWALYAEAWRDGKKAFTPTERVGFLVNHLWRAARLVVDTGLHTGTMTQSQAARYFQKSTFVTKTTAQAEIQRYMDWPGQALAYYVGKRQLLSVQREVKRTLGKNYDARKFHTRLLRLGSVPPRELRKAMTSWANRRAGQYKHKQVSRAGRRRR